MFWDPLGSEFGRPKKKKGLPKGVRKGFSTGDIGVLEKRPRPGKTFLFGVKITERTPWGKGRKRGGTQGPLWGKKSKQEKRLGLSTWKRTCLKKFRPQKKKGTLGGSAKGLQGRSIQEKRPEEIPTNWFCWFRKTVEQPKRGKPKGAKQKARPVYGTFMPRGNTVFREKRWAHKHPIED